MGLDANVGCRCLQDGLVVPPVPAGLVRLDEDGYPDLTVPYAGNEELHHRFDGWVRTGCSHQGMDLAWVHVSNWSGYHSFRRALDELGRLPVLAAELPELNGGTTAPAAAALALDELALFRELYAGERLVLVDGSGEQLQEYSVGSLGVFVWGGRSGVDIGFDEHGLFVRGRSDPGQELFRALRTGQQVLAAGPKGAERVVFTDLDSGTRFDCGAGVSGRQIPWPDGRMQDDEGRLRFDYPDRLGIETRIVTADWYTYILEPLEQIFSVAVTAGNPVRWC